MEDSGKHEFKKPEVIENNFIDRTGEWRIARIDPLCDPDYTDNESLGFVATIRMATSEMSVDVWGHHCSKEDTKSCADLLLNAKTLPELATAILSHSEGKLHIDYLVEMAKEVLNKT